MCCVFSSLVLLGPRAAILFWWLFQQTRWELAFDSFFWPLVGFLFAPWTTLMYVAVLPGGGLEGFDWIWMTLAILADFVSWTGGSYTNRRRIPGY